MRRDQLFETISTDLSMIDLPSAIRRIGRGQKGSSNLTRSETQVIFQQIFSGTVSPEQLAAVLIALRMKGEHSDELLGALDAVNQFKTVVPVLPSKPLVSLPSYNGARHLPNLTWLLALLLARQGIQVIVHTQHPATGPGAERTSTESVARAVGAKPVTILSDCLELFQTNQPALVPLSLVCPALATLIDYRQELGVRNIAHSLVKLLNPCEVTHCLRVTAYTHPDFRELQQQVFERLGEPALIMRATEGEVVANVRRANQIVFMQRGIPRTLVEQALPGFNTSTLPDCASADATARYIAGVLDGSLPVPTPLIDQVEAIDKAAHLALQDRP